MRMFIYLERLRLIRMLHIRTGQNYNFLGNAMNQRNHGYQNIVL